jgi:DNA-binding transcriptional regulator YiaG
MTGPEFRDARITLLLTQPELAQLLDVGVSTIRKWERVEMIPTIVELALIAVTMLLEDEDPEPALNGTVAVRGAA